MEIPGAGPKQRMVRIHTTYGVFEGVMPCSPVMRTLDAINQLATGYVTLQPPVTTPFGAPFGPGPVAISRASILYIQEMSDTVQTVPSAKMGLPRFWMAPVVLRVGDLVVHGYVHVPLGGNPLMRLSTTEGPPFLALTAVEAHGTQGEWKFSFLAVNRAHVTAAQEVVESEETEDTEEPVEDSVRSDRRP